MNVTKKIRTNIGDKRINPISDKVKSNIRNIFFTSIFFAIYDLIVKIPSYIFIITIDNVPVRVY